MTQSLEIYVHFNSDNVKAYTIEELNRSYASEVKMMRAVHPSIEYGKMLYRVVLKGHEAEKITIVGKVNSTEAHALEVLLKYVVSDASIKINLYETNIASMDNFITILDDLEPCLTKEAQVFVHRENNISSYNIETLNDLYKQIGQDPLLAEILVAPSISDARKIAFVGDVKEEESNVLEMLIEQISKLDSIDTIIDFSSSNIPALEIRSITQKLLDCRAKFGDRVKMLDDEDEDNNEPSSASPAGPSNDEDISEPHSKRQRINNDEQGEYHNLGTGASEESSPLLGDTDSNIDA